MLNCSVWKKTVHFGYIAWKNSIFFWRWSRKIPASSVITVFMHIAIDSLVRKTLFWHWFWWEFRQFLKQLHWGLQLGVSQNVEVKSTWCFSYSRSENILLGGHVMCRGWIKSCHSLVTDSMFFETDHTFHFTVGLQLCGSKVAFLFLVSIFWFFIISQQIQSQLISWAWTNFNSSVTITN